MTFHLGWRDDVCFVLFLNIYLLYLLRSVLFYPGMLHHFNFIIVYISIVSILLSQNACWLFIIFSFPEATKHGVYVLYTHGCVCP